ncbi:protease acp1 [Mycena amicta]|nr:protease acp1 [Mycena amicta]
MKKIGEARKRNRLTGRAAAATVTSSNWVRLSSSSACSKPDFSPQCGSAQTGTGFTSVVGTWTVPAITRRSGQSSSSEPAISQWVGIDGFSNSALIQGGTLSQLVGSTQENVAWTEMLPAASRDVSLTVSTGNSITTNVHQTSATSGTVSIINNSRGTSIVGTVSGGTRLSATSAEWILEDFESGSSLVAFAGFPASTFTGSAVHSGSSVTPAGSTLIDLVQSSELCSATLSGSTVRLVDS